MLSLRELMPQFVPISKMNLLEHFFFWQEQQLSFKVPASKAVQSSPQLPTFIVFPYPHKKWKSLFITLLTISFASGCMNTITQSLTAKVISTFLSLTKLEASKSSSLENGCLNFPHACQQISACTKADFPVSIQDAIFNYLLMASSYNLGFLTAHNP